MLRIVDGGGASAACPPSDGPRMGTRRTVCVGCAAETTGSASFSQTGTRRMAPSAFRRFTAVWPVSPRNLADKPSHLARFTSVGRETVETPVGVAGSAAMRAFRESLEPALPGNSGAGALVPEPPLPPSAMPADRRRSGSPVSSRTVPRRPAGLLVIRGSPSQGPSPEDARHHGRIRGSTELASVGLATVLRESSGLALPLPHKSSGTFVRVRGRRESRPVDKFLSRSEIVEVYDSLPAALGAGWRVGTARRTSASSGDQDDRLTEIDWRLRRTAANVQTYLWGKGRARGSCDGRSTIRRTVCGRARPPRYRVRA